MDNPLREQRIRAAMERDAAHAVPRADLWSAIEEQLADLPATPAMEQNLPAAAPTAHHYPLRLRLTSIAAAIVVLALGLSVALPALLPPRPLPQGNSPAITMPLTPTYAANDGPDLMPITMSVRAQPLHLSQMVSGYSVMLNRVYLDASTLMLSYNISGPHTRYVSAMGDLGYASRAALSLLPSQSWQVANQVADGATVRGIASFDPPAVISTSLELRLSLSLTRNPEIDIHSVSPPLTPNLAQNVAGPFEFSFTAPFVGDLKTINIGQQAISGGVTITLEQALLTPGQTQLALRYSGAAANPRLAWRPDLSLIGPDGKPLVGDGAAQISQRADGSWVYATSAPLFEQSGQWSVRIDALDGYDRSDTKANETQLTGPWTFQFMIPATR